MAAEAVHISVLWDMRTQQRLPQDLLEFLSKPDIWECARLGALIVDFPYFEDFPMAVFRHLTGLPQAYSSWGDLIHGKSPVALGRSFIDVGLGLKKNQRPALADRFIALGLGFISHVAVDYQTHHLVNTLSRRRAAHGGHEFDHHRTIEKYQSVLLHEHRNGRNFLGGQGLWAYISVDCQWLTHSKVGYKALASAFQSTFSICPSQRRFRNWSRGYDQYCALISGPIGLTLSPRAEKLEEYPLVFKTPEFSYLAVYNDCVDRVERYLKGAWQYVQSGQFPHDIIPEGSIDHPPQFYLQESS